MAGAVADRQNRLRGGVMHRFAKGERRHPVLSAPDDQQRHFQRREFRIQNITAGDHGIPSSAYDPTVPIRQLQKIVLDEFGNRTGSPTNARN